MHVDRLIKWTLLTLIVALFHLPALAVAGGEGPLEQAATLLKSKKFSDKAQAVELLAEDVGDQAKSLMDALLDSRLYYIKGSSPNQVGRLT